MPLPPELRATYAVVAGATLPDKGRLYLRTKNAALLSVKSANKTNTASAFATMPLIGPRALSIAVAAPNKAASGRTFPAAPWSKTATPPVEPRPLSATKMGPVGAGGGAAVVNVTEEAADG